MSDPVLSVPPEIRQAAAQAICYCKEGAASMMRDSTGKMTFTYDSYGPCLVHRSIADAVLAATVPLIRRQALEDAINTLSYTQVNERDAIRALIPTPEAERTLADRISSLGLSGNLKVEPREAEHG
jgi:hypothetical protein